MNIRQQKSAETKNNLLNTALELFAAHGFEHVSIAQITKACGVSKGTFYTHFQTKYDVILEKFNALDEYYITVVKEIPNHLNASEKILALYDAQMTYLRDVIGKDFMRTVYTAAMTNQVAHNHYLIDPKRTIFQLMHTFIREGIEQGEFRVDMDAQHIEHIIQRAMRANVYDWLIHTEFDLVDEMHRFTATLLAGIKKGP
ncbi:TetR/AcrR family transcriptional regulator [Kurthia massiliensis]|uniref:TetR/AcrR family transcriptional regulator n=1 Tax=Kurthia massiliensis TaxID=1033739 RepID=UPI000287E774|nr:TetR family transcriptional regulator [Kurthia massiliensis]